MCTVHNICYSFVFLSVQHIIHEELIFILSIHFIIICSLKKRKSQKKTSRKQMTAAIIKRIILYSADPEAETISAINKLGEIKLKNGCCKSCMKAFSKMGKVFASSELLVSSAALTEKSDVAYQWMQILWL